MRTPKRSIALLGIVLTATLLGGAFAFSATFAASPLPLQPASNSGATYEPKATTTTRTVSAQDYDRMKNCAADTSKQANFTEYLTHFNCGQVTVDKETGQVTREFTLIVKEDVPVQISENPTHVHDAWTFNGTVPGPTIRVTEGDHVRIKVVNLANSTFPHSLHMHSIHESVMDGVQTEPILPGGSFVYDFVAQPAGVYPYHCHIDPLHDHINRGLYGVMIIDPKTPRPAMPEMVMMLNGYDLDYDQEGPTLIRPELEEGEEPPEEAERGNEIYTVNGYAFGHMMQPIQIEQDQKYRIYVVNMLEFDLINSFHIHGALFDYYPSGIGDRPAFTNDVIELGQGNRGIMELEYKYPGKYMFHAHVTEFTDLGWMGFFDVHAPHAEKGAGNNSKPLLQIAPKEQQQQDQQQSMIHGQ